MPSPIGHALGGMIAGWLVEGRREGPARSRGSFALSRAAREAAWFAAIGMAPDLDLLVGLHSTYTHSVGAVAVVAGVAWAWAVRHRRPRRWAMACAAALASHILLDWLGSDTTAPIGIMALWPFSPEFYQSPLYLFPAVSRRFGEWSFVVQNTRAALFEIAVLVPIAAGVGWASGRFGVAVQD